jgi:hypothetical protein
MRAAQCGPFWIAISEVNEHGAMSVIVVTDTGSYESASAMFSSSVVVSLVIVQ